MTALLPRAGTGWRRFQYLFIGCLALILAGAACGQEGTPPATSCPDDNYPAVELELVDEAGEGLLGARLRYRVDEGPWQAWPENAGQRTVIRGRPGLYRLEVSKQGHETVATTLDVPASAGEACRPATETVRLQLARVPCPGPPEDLFLTVNPPLDGLEVEARLPDSGRQTLICLDTERGSCLRYSLPAGELGPYRLTLKGLPGLGPMQVVNNVVVYDPPMVELSLEHRGQRRNVDATGGEAATLAFPVGRDEANCALADFRALETTLEPDPAAEPQPPLAVSYQGSLTITDVGASACRGEPVQTPLSFAVDLPAGTDLADVQVLVEYGEGWRPATCGFGAGHYSCQALVPNPLLDRPFAVRVLASGEEAAGMQLPFSGMCLIFE